MSETESTQLWNDEDDDLQSGQSFSDALASLEEHLQDQKDEALPEDEEQVYAEAFEEGADFDPGIDANGEPAAVSYADLSEDDAGLSLDAELDAAFPEPDLSASLDDELDAAFTDADMGRSLDDELDDAYSAPDVSASLDDELDHAFVETVAAATLDDGVGGASDDTEVEDDDFLASDDEEAGVDEDFASYPAYDQPEEDAVSYAPDVQEESPAASPMAAMMGGQDGTDDFNLATLTQLVDEIRQESTRVAEMKDSVARALSLIQEMSESLKS